jgi:hypothetical protein
MVPRGTQWSESRLDTGLSLDLFLFNPYVYLI